MRYAIMGSGGVGGYFGARLAAAGNDVTFVARGKHLAAIATDGLKIESPRGDVHIHPASATDDPHTIDPVDVVIFTPKLWDTDVAAVVIQPVLGPETAVVSLQNGVVASERLSAILGSAHVMGGVAEIASTIARPGLIRHLSPFARLIFGEPDGERSPRAEALLRDCGAAGIDCELTDDIHAAIWRKFVFLVAFSGATAVTRHGIGSVRDDPETRQLLVELMEETMAVARGKGIEMSDDVLQERMKTIDEFPPQSSSSMARDLAQGNRLETEWLQGEVVRLGRELGIPTPANRFAYAALKLSANGTTP